MKYAHPMPIILVTDSNCDLPPALIERYNIRVVASLLNLGGQSYRDGVDMSRAEFYARLPTLRPLPTTAAPASGVFEALYRECGDADILSIHIASSLSGFYNAARLGAEASGARVTLIDSGQLSMGFGWQVLAAAEAIAAGKTLAEVVAEVQAIQQRIKVFAVLDTLENLRHSGRANAVVTMVGTLLHIKPMIELTGGQVKLVARQRTRGKAVDTLIVTVNALGPLDRLAVLHACNPTEAEALAQRLAPQSHTPPLLMEIAAVIGTHLGPGAMGVAAVTQPRERFAQP
jgi:DegV family protein with EDD domain